MRELPIQSTSFIGREKELAHLGALLLGGRGRGQVGGRLVVLVGPEGIGKTRLLLQAITNLGENFRDGLLYLDLSPLAKPAQFQRTVASALGLREEQKRAVGDVIVEYLNTRQMLLVLDHCDRFSTAVRDLTRLILRGCPGLTLLISGQEPLKLENETIYRLPALSVPNLQGTDPEPDFEKYDAVRLLLARSNSASPDFPVTDQTLLLAAQIVNRLEGIPLAIELASAQIRQKGIDGIAVHLEELFAKTEGKKGPVHSIELILYPLIGWSRELLKPEEQALLWRVSLFPDGFTWEAALALIGEKGLPDPGAEKISSGAKESLEHLVNQALIQEQSLESGSRFYLPDAVRKCVTEHFDVYGEVEEAHKAYLSYYLGWAERAEPELRGKDQQMWLRRIETELNNLRLALELALEKQPTVGLRMASALWWFWYVQGRLCEGFEWLDRLLIASEQHHTIHRGRALARASALAWLMDDGITASRLAMSGLGLSEALVDRPGVAMARFVQGMVARNSNLDESKRYLEESLVLFEQLDDSWSAARSLFHLGGVAYGQGDIEHAAVRYRESELMCRAIGDFRGEATALNALGALANLNGDLSQSKTFYQACLQASRQAANQQGVATALQNLGELALGFGDYQEAEKLLSESLTLHHKIGNLTGEIRSLIWLGHAALGLDQLDQAVDSFTQALAFAKKKNSGELEAQALYGLGETSRVDGNLAQAKFYYGRALALRRHSGSATGLACLLEAFAVVSVKEQRPAMSAEFLGAAAKLRETSWPGAASHLQKKSERTLKVERTVENLRQTLGIGGYQDAWQRGRDTDLESLLQKLESYTSSTNDPSSPVELLGPIHTR